MKIEAIRVQFASEHYGALRRGVYARRLLTGRPVDAREWTPERAGMSMALRS